MRSTPTYRGSPGAAHRFGALGLAALLAASFGCAAQTRPDIEAGRVAPAAVAPAPPPIDPPPAPPANAPMPPAAGPDGRVAPLADQGTPVTTQAAVARFVTNPDGDVDGFLTADGALVRFPPHMSAQLVAAVRPGDSVQVSGSRDSAGDVAAQRIVDTSSGRQLIEQPPSPGAPPMPRELRGAGLSPLSVQGHVAHVTTAPRGEPDGVILADGTVIKLTPPVAQQFPALMRTGASVSAQGYGTRNQYGTALQATAFGAPGNVTRLYDRAPPAP